MTKEETLYQYWEQNDLPVKIHAATEHLFNAYKYGASGHAQKLREAFPDYFVYPWTVCFNPNHKLAKLKVDL